MPQIDEISTGVHNPNAMTAVAVLQRDSIIEQLSRGLRLSDIAPALQVSPNAISKALKTDPEYRDAIAAGFHCRLDKAEEDMENAQEQVDVARTRARFQSVAWRAERECPEIWGAKSQLHVTGAVTLDLILSAEDSGEKVIESESDPELPAP